MVGVGVSLLPRVFRASSLQRASGKYHDALRAEFRLPTSIIGGVLGGLSHSLIDSVIYTDFHPFAPLSVQNPLHGLITPGDLSYSLLLTGVIGFVLLVSRAVFIWQAKQ